MLREAVLYQYVYLAAQVEDQAGQAGWTDRAWLQATLEGAVGHPYAWLGSPLPAGEPSIQWPAQGERRRAVRLYPPHGEPLDWSLNDRWAAYADVRLGDGTLALQLAYGCREEADDEARGRLAQAAWTPPADAGLVLGQTLCFGGRVPDLATALAEAGRALPADLAYPLPLRRADLPLGLAGPDSTVAWLFDRPGLPDRLALFYPDSDEAEAAASGLVNRALPDLALALHKIAHQYDRGYEQGLRPLLAHEERALAAVLLVPVRVAADGPPSGDVEELDGRLRELAAAYNDFAADLAAFQRLAQAVRVNLLNLRQAFNEHSLPREGPLAVRLTAAERAMEQLEADDGFYQARVHQAEMALAALQVQADIERNRIEQEETRQAERRNRLLGFIGMVLALGQIMTDDVVLAFMRWLLAFFGLVSSQPTPEGIIFGVKLLLVLAAGLAGVGLVWGLGRLWGWLRGRQA